MKSDKYLGCGECSVFIILYLLITLVDAFFIQYGLSAWVTDLSREGRERKLLALLNSGGYSIHWAARHSICGNYFHSDVDSVRRE